MVTAEAVLFDLDQTLLDGSGFRDSVVGTCKSLAALEPRLTVAHLLEANARVWKSYWYEIEAPWTLGAVDGASVNQEAWRRTLELCGCNDETVTEHAVRAHSRLEQAAHRLFGDVQDLFDALRKARIPLGLITNGASDTQRQKLRALGIEDWFDVVVISGEIGSAKPDARPFTSATEQLAVRGKRVWHVGDNLATDVAGAASSGLTAVWLNRARIERSRTDPEPDVEIASLSELLRLLPI